jgi:hypothetical protein
MLGVLEDLLELQCPAPMPLCSAAEDGMPCLTWKETAAAVTDEPVKEGLRWRLVGADIPELRADLSGDNSGLRSGVTLWKETHPKWHKALKWGGAAFGLYALGRVAHHNEWLHEHDEGDTRNVTINEGGEFCWPPGHCK